MGITTCTLEEKNFLKLPEILRKGWNVTEGCYLHAIVSNKVLTISKTSKGSAVLLRVLSGFKIVLPFYFVKSLGLKIGDKVQLTLEDNLIHLYKSNIQPLNSPVRNKNKLEAKLEAELEIKLSSRNHSNVLFEDVYNFLLLDNWNDDVVKSLLAKEDLLEEIVSRLREDDIFNHVFEEQVRKVTLEYIANRETISK